MKLSHVLAALVLVAAPRVARADLWINVDGRWVMTGDRLKQCSNKGWSGGFRVYQCSKGDGTVWFHDPDELWTCVLSIWTSGGSTWHADIQPDPKYPKSICKMHWINDNTLKVYPG